MKTPRTTKGLAILAGGLAFVGSANAVDLIVNGSFEDVNGGPTTPAGWTGQCKGYNYSAAYFTGPPIPASENPGSVYSWQHTGTPGDNTWSTPMTQTVDLLTAVTAANIDSGRGQYTFSAWLASYGQPGTNPDAPYLTIRFLDASTAQVGSTVVLDRVSGSFFTTFADGVTTFDSTTHLHDWAKYVRTSAIPIGARTAIVGIQHSPNSGLSGTPDTYTDLVKLDVTVADTRPSFDSAAPTGINVAGNASVNVTIQDGSIAVNQAAIAMSFDGVAVTPSISKNGPITTVNYTPPLMQSGSTHAYQVIFADNGNPVKSQTNNYGFVVANYTTLPATYARPVGSGSEPGLTYRTVQEVGTGLANSLARTQKQLDGTLIDPGTGLPYPNTATPGPNVDGSYNIDGVINFEQAGQSAGNFPGDLPFPGLAPGDQDNFATEAILNLALPAGYYRFGVNSDDGFMASIGTDPVDPTAPSTVLGFYDGGRGTSDTLFDFYVPTAGVYTMRLIYEEGAVEAACELFSVDVNTGQRTLINDPAVVSSIKSFRTVTGLARPAYVRDATPSPGSANIPVDTKITAHLWDRTTAVVNGSVQMTLNGTPVVSAVSKDGIVTTVSYQPGTPLAYRTTYTVQITFNDGTGPLVRSWTFTTRGADQPPAITGQWDFDASDLHATIGVPLEYFGTTAGKVAFGTTTSFGIPDINGFPAHVIKMPTAVDDTIGLTMRHGAVPNGGATASKVNQWTLIMDIFIPVQSGQWFSFVQIDDLANSNDGELFANFGSAAGNSGGLGISSQYTGANNIFKGQWHRVAFAVDAGSVITKFIDGVKFADQTTWDGLGIDGRHAMLDRAILFADNDGDSLQCYVNSVQFRNYKMKDSELAALGGPDADGISTVSGQWDFEDETTFESGRRATIGADMVLLPGTDIITSYVPVTFGSQEANCLVYSVDVPTTGYLIVPGSTGNGGGQKINQYTLMMDMLFPASSIDSWHSLWQTRTNNNDDASLFVRPVSSGGGVGISGVYHGNLLPDTWYRLAFTFDLTTKTLKKYTNGVLAGQQTLGEGIDGRWAVDTTALLFADNDGDNAAGTCNSVQFHPRVLTDAEILRLGAPSVAGLPVSIPHPLTMFEPALSGFDLQLRWAGGIGPYQVQTKESLSSGSWENLGAPTTDRATTVDRFDPIRFYRVIGQ